MCHVLKEDPELAEAIPPERRQQAIEDCTAPELLVQPGPLARPSSLGFRGGIGVLVLSCDVVVLPVDAGALPIDAVMLSVDA
jgi:hypothetical protein